MKMSENKIEQDNARYGVLSIDEIITTRCVTNRILELLCTEQAENVRFLDMGMGNGSVPEILSKSISEYTVIEGDGGLIESFRKKNPESKIRVIHSLFEDYETDDKYDVINMGFILEHVKDPVALMKKYSRLLEERGRMFLSVPNACSLHRRVGYEAGLLEDMHMLSEEDRRFGHVRYYDKDSFEKDIRSAGLQILRTEGLFLKPVTTAQMKMLDLPDTILDAFCTVGRGYPELCNSLFVEAMLG